MKTFPLVKFRISGYKSNNNMWCNFFRTHSTFDVKESSTRKDIGNSISCKEQSERTQIITEHIHANVFIFICVWNNWHINVEVIIWITLTSPRQMVVMYNAQAPTHITQNWDWQKHETFVLVTARLWNILKINFLCNASSSSTVYSTPWRIPLE